MLDHEVPAFWSSLGLPGIIDLHVHFMPHNVMRKVWAYFDAYPSGWPIRYRGEETVRLDLLAAMGVRRFPSLIYPHKPGMAAWLNGWAGEFASAHPEVLHTGTFYPEPGAGDYVRAGLEAGVTLWKSHVQVGAYDPRDPLLDEVWGMLADAGTPVITHCGSGPQPGPFTGPGPIGEVLARHPTLVCVIAHMGNPEYTEMLELAENYDRVGLDTTITFTPFSERMAPYPAALLDRVRALGLAGKVVFGSDYPNIPHSYGEALDSVIRLDLGEDWLRAVLWENPAAIMRVAGAELPAGA